MLYNIGMGSAPCPHFWPTGRESYAQWVSHAVLHGLCDSHADSIRKLKIRVWGSQKGSIPQTRRSSGTAAFGRPLCSIWALKRGAKSAVVGPVNGHEKCSAWALQTTETRLLKAKCKQSSKISQNSPESIPLQAVPEGIIRQKVYQSCIVSL